MRQVTLEPATGSPTLMNPRTVLVILLIIALLGGAVACHVMHPSKTFGPSGASLAPDAAPATDWTLWLSVGAGVLAAIETCIRVILQLVTRAKNPTPAPETPDVKPPPSG